LLGPGATGIVGASGGVTHAPNEIVRTMATVIRGSIGFTLASSRCLIVRRSLEPEQAWQAIPAEGERRREVDDMMTQSSYDIAALSDLESDSRL
jgi:hypothetical protein